MGGKDWLPGIRSLILKMAAAWLLRPSTKGASWRGPSLGLIDREFH